MTQETKRIHPSFPCPVPPKPPMARGWCKHYSYIKPEFPRSTKITLSSEGPQCAVGCDPSTFGDRCYPDPTDVCSKRENWSDKEKAIWEEWQHHHVSRMLVCLDVIPSDVGEGSFTCPACGTGTLRWSRARSNRHLHALCSTPNCFGFIQ